MNKEKKWYKVTYDGGWFKADTIEDIINTVSGPGNFYEGNWCHRTWLKCIVNPILRFIQFWTDKPYVISSITEFKDGLPYFQHYSLQRVKYLKKFIFFYKKD